VAEPRSEQHQAYGEAIRELRGSLGLSQEQLARISGLDRTYVSGIERGERNPSLTNLLKIADQLEVPVSVIARLAERKLASE
jgi:transcriptional regulator with XRE-family HTH domain